MPDISSSPITVVLCLAAVLSAGCGSPERAIAERLDELWGLAEKEGPESALAAAARANEIAAYFAEEFEVIAAPLDFRTRDRARLVRAIVGYRRSNDRIRARATGREIVVDEETRRGTSVVTAEFSGPGLAVGGRDAYDFRFAWVEGSDGVWRIDQLELLAVRRAD